MKKEKGKNTLRGNRGLTSEGLQHLHGSGESITALTNGDVQDELVDGEGSHRVFFLLLVGLCANGRRGVNF